MQIFSDYRELATHHLNHPVILTIGNFDGVHRGHQKIFETMRHLKKHQQGTLIVLTFSNHPLEVIHPEIVVSKITPLEEKLSLLKEEDIDITFLLEFTQELKKMSYIDFLKEIKKRISFDHLVLGKDAAFGSNKEGNEAALKNLESTLHFKTHYVERLEFNDQVISSKSIRAKLEEGDVVAVESLLGRHYALFAPHHIASLQETGENKLKITYDFASHCLLPSGYYIVKILTDQHECTAVAYLTTLASDLAAKTFDLEIFIKTSKAPFMNDRIKIEFLRKTSKINLPQDLELTGCKVIPFKAS